MREFRIHVIISDDMEESGAIWRQAAEGFYTVILSKPQLEMHNAELLIAAAHELGHVLCKEFNAPHHSKTPNNAMIPPELVMPVEREAWDLAETLLRLQHLKAYALTMHERALNLQPEIKHDFTW